MPLNHKGESVRLKVGQLTTIDGVWFRVKKITRKEIVFRLAPVVEAEAASKVVQADATRRQEDARDDV